MANKIINYIIESKNELKNVAWPTKREIKYHTLLVIGISLGVALFLGAADYILNIALSKII